MIKLPEGITVAMLKGFFDMASTEYASAHNKAKKLDLADRGKLWQAVGAKYPTYQILPETNHVAYVKSNILASIYTVGKSASILPTTEQDKDFVENLNVSMEHIWSQLDVSKYQMMAGERAALMNLGVTQVGWDNNIVTGNGDTFEKGRCRLKNINPLRYMRDPFADCLDNSSFVLTWDEFHKSAIESNANYRTEFKEFLVKNTDSMDGSGFQVKPPTDRASQDATGKRDYYRVYTYWVKQGGSIHEIHLVNNQHVLYLRESIKPNAYPLVELYCNLPVNDLLGVSEPNKIFANSLAYNIMNSLVLTSEYKNQQPPKFVNAQSGLNIQSFSKHGNEADKTFITNGDASRAVHYHQFPPISGAGMAAMGTLSADMQTVSGVDGRYTGRDTGSILTTGGINSMLDQVTMIDAPKVANYETYCKRLTNLIVMNYIQFSAMDRKYFVKDKKNPNRYKTVKVNFKQQNDDTFLDYELMISSELPKNKTVLANAANKLMEMQMQYSASNIEADLITPQEWLMLQDLPNKEYMLERMNIQRNQDYLEIAAQVINQYTSLVEAGVQPNDAMLATADTIAAQQTPGGGGVQDVANNLMQGGML